MNQQQESEKSTMTFRIRSEEQIQKDVTNRKNFGYAVLSKIYHELGIHTFLINRQRHAKHDYDANSIMKLLVFSRLFTLFPRRKRMRTRSIFRKKQFLSG